MCHPFLLVTEGFPLPTLQRRIGLGFTLAGWALLLLLFAWLAGGFFEREMNPNSDVRATSAGAGPLEVVLQRNRAGHYIAPGTINDRAVSFLVDTGATQVAVDAKMATVLGLEPGSASTVRTANGVVQGRRTLIASIDVAGIRQYSVPAILLPNLGDQVLLGMSFLKRVELVQRGDQLRLRETRP